jgi:hypothetical protein
MFYYPSKSNNGNNNNNDNNSNKLDLEKTARLCWLDIESNQTLNNIHAICLFCEQLSFEPITTYLYSQPYGDYDRIRRQNVLLCQKCIKDFEDYQIGFIAREQEALDLYDYEHGIQQDNRQQRIQKPKLYIEDYYDVALRQITHACVSKLCEKAGIEMMTNSLTSLDRMKIKDACMRDEHPTDVLEVSRELFDSGNNNNSSVRRFFYYRRQNIDSRFKPLWKIRWQLQELLGE